MPSCWTDIFVLRPLVVFVTVTLPVREVDEVFSLRETVKLPLLLPLVFDKVIQFWSLLTVHESFDVTVTVFVLDE